MIPVCGRILMGKCFFSYWIGLSYQSAISRSNISLHLAVAAGVVVLYDWGEQDVVLKLLPFL
jgi:hypothetical protein